jgi:hypothetical protein
MDDGPMDPSAKNRHRRFSLGSPSKLWRSNKFNTSNNSNNSNNSGLMSSSSRGGGLSLQPILPSSSSSGGVNGQQHSRYSSSSAMQQSSNVSASFRQKHFVLFAISLSLLVGISIGGALFGLKSFCNLNYDVLDEHHLVVPANVDVRNAIESLASDAEISPVASGSQVAIGTREDGEEGGVDYGEEEDIVSAIEAAADNDDIETGDASPDDVADEGGGRTKTLRGGGGGGGDGGIWVTETDASEASGAKEADVVGDDGI